MPLPESAALLAPIAPHTRSVMIALARTVEASGRYVIPFQWPVEVVGLHVNVIANSAEAGGLIAPTIEALLCDLSVNEGRKFTSAVRDSDLAAGSSFADLQALGLLAPRVISIPLGGPSELAFELRWKRWIAGAPIYEDALITISALFRRIELAELHRLRAMLGPAD